VGFRVEAAAGKPSIPLDIRGLRQSGPIRARSEQGIIDWLSGNDHSLMGFIDQHPHHVEFSGMVDGRVVRHGWIAHPNRHTQLKRTADPESWSLGSRPLENIRDLRDWLVFGGHTAPFHSIVPSGWA
jgi:hypothetical protein